MFNGYERAQRDYDNQLPPEPKVYCCCEICGDDIIYGADYYEVENMNVCLNCANLRVAEDNYE